jgi:hypothetical protein
MTVPGSDFAHGLGLGLLLGVMVGSTWVKAWEVMKAAHDERMEKMSHLDNTSAWVHLQSLITRIRNMTLLEVVLTWVSVMLTLLGIFQVYAYTKQQAFINCQARYNSDFSAAYAARSDAAVVENNQLYTALGYSLHHTDPRDRAAQAEAKRQFALAFQLHQTRLRTAKQNPLPEPPEETCGTP